MHSSWPCSDTQALAELGHGLSTHLQHLAVITLELPDACNLHQPALGIVPCLTGCTSLTSLTIRANQQPHHRALDLDLTTLPASLTSLCLGPLPLDEGGCRPAVFRIKGQGSVPDAPQSGCSGRHGYQHKHQ